jgi:hypothetical protein
MLICNAIALAGGVLLNRMLARGSEWSYDLL